MKKKKVLPNIKKTLKKFLTDESGKVTKKDVLWISVWSIALSATFPEDALWARCTNFESHSSNSSHSSWCSATSQSSISWYNSWWHVNKTLRWSSSTTSNLYWGDVYASTAHASSIGSSDSSHSSPTSSWNQKTVYNSWGHLNYTARGSSKSQSSISGYTHSSGSSHSSFVDHTNHSNWATCDTQLEP